MDRSDPIATFRAKPRGCEGMKVGLTTTIATSAMVDPSSSPQHLCGKPSHSCPLRCRRHPVPIPSPRRCAAQFWTTRYIRPSPLSSTSSCLPEETLCKKVHLASGRSARLSTRNPEEALPVQLSRNRPPTTEAFNTIGMGTGTEEVGVPTVNGASGIRL